MPFRPIADAFAFSSLLAASIGFGLSVVTSLVVDAPNPLHWALLAATGTFIIYNLDRLRDTTRDVTTSPERTTFIQRHRTALTNAVTIVAVAFGGLLFAAPAAIATTCIGVGLIGLFHRRIKNAAALKTLYVSLAWIVACVGIPWLAAGRPESGLWVAAVMSPVLCANLIASNLRDDEIQILRSRPEMALPVARGLLAVAIVVAVIAPVALKPPVWLAIAEAIALWRFRKSERYRLLVVDGALLAGSLAAAIHFLLLD